MNQKKKLIEIGKIVTTSGIKGACVVMFYIENENSLKKYNRFYDSKGSIFKFSIISKTSNQKNSDLMTRSFRFLIKIDGINSPEDALKFINQSIFIEQEELSSEKLDENESEFYIQDLINMNIFLEGNSEEVAGKVHAVRDFGGGPLIEIAPNLKFKKIFGPNLMFIFNDENFPKIDLEKKEIYLKFPEFCE